MTEHPSVTPDRARPDEPDGRLTPLERRILEIEGQWFRHAGSKEALVREELGLSGVRYYQLLNRLLDRPEALRFAPLTVNRLRGLRERSRRGRWQTPSDHAAPDPGADRGR